MSTGGRSAGRAALLILMSAALVALWRWAASELLSPHAAFAASFVLLGLVPAAGAALWGRKPSCLGLRAGDARQGLRWLLLLAPIMLAAAHVAAHDPAVAAVYPLAKNACGGPLPFGWHCVLYLLFYIGWEFQFRGFLLFGLRDVLGAAPAIAIQALLSAAAHAGKPPAEIWGALAAGVLWGALALRTRSLLSGLLQHALLGIALDYLLCFGPTW